MKKGLRVFEFVLFPTVVFILLLTFIIVAIGNSSNSEKKRSYSVDAATVDAACKDYYAICVAGQAPGEGSTRRAINEFTNAASIKDALEYANLKDVDLSNMIVDSYGSIRNTDNSGNIAADETKTALLSNPSAAGSLKALYVK